MNRDQLKETRASIGVAGEDKEDEPILLGREDKVRIQTYIIP